MWGRLPFTKKCEFVFHLQINVRSSSIYQKSEIVFYLQKNVMLSSIYKRMWCRLPFTKKCEVDFHLQKKWGCLPFTKKMWGRLPFTKNMRSSSIHMLDGQFIWIRQFGYFSGPRPTGGRPADGQRTAGTLIIELTQLNFNWNCQLELSLAIPKIVIYLSCSAGRMHIARTKLYNILIRCCTFL
jgi:hypothetical protein